MIQNQLCTKGSFATRNCRYSIANPIVAVRELTLHKHPPWHSWDNLLEEGTQNVLTLLDFLLLLVPFPGVLHLQVLLGLTTVWSFTLTWSSTRSRNWTFSLKQATALTSKNAKCLLGLVLCFWLYSGQFLLPCGPSGFRVIWGFRLLSLAELQCVTFEACVCRGEVSEMFAVFLIALLMLQGLEGAEEFLNALAVTA